MELSDIKTPILPSRPFKCLYIYSHECSVDLDKINLFKKSTKLPARIVVTKSSKCIPSFHKCLLEILSLEIKPNPFNTHSSLKLLFTCRIRRVNAIFHLSKIDDITTSFTPRLMQDLPILIISPVCFSVFILSFVWLFISLETICRKTTSGWSSWVGRI